MKKILFLAIVAILAFGCSKEGETPMEQKEVSTYSLYYGYSARDVVAQKLSYDAHLTETLFFYEYDANNNKIDQKRWENPQVGQEKTFTANDSAIKAVVKYEIHGTLKDGSEYASSRYLQEVIKLSKGNNSVITMSASTKMSENSPI
ncbi:MAG: hypothetical protein KBS73_07615 [Bacteroidales bacterium]|nr:hypothetical protein [Candidatus Cacconaster equifaecalis]